MERFSRRTFMKLAGAAAGVIAFTPLRSVFAKNDVDWVSVGPLEEFKVGDPVLVDKGVESPVIIFREMDGIKALSAQCTHKGCTVRVRKNDIYTCPCHGSQFEYDGTVTKGPAQRDLKQLMVKVSEKGELLVGM
jgi:Rieske Fe-S protein